jgi:ankyrin repeat protein
MMRVLLDRHMIDVNARDDAGISALYRAARDGNTEVVEMLLAEPEIDPNLLTNKGWSALAVALHLCRSEAAQKLIECRKTDINLCVRGQRAPMVIAMVKGMTNCIRALCRRPDLIFREGEKLKKSLLEIAVSVKNEEAVRAIIDLPGMKVTATACGWKRARRLAKKNGLVGCVKLLDEKANEKRKAFLRWIGLRNAASVVKK